MILDMGRRGPKPSNEFREPALRMRLEGQTFKAISEQLGISRQRVQQLLSPPRDVRDRIVIAAQGHCATCNLFVGSSGHVHHQQARGLDQEDYNDYPNLVLLCSSCHRRAHKAAPAEKIGPARPAATGATIREFRDRFSLNQAQFAKLMGVTQTAVSRWESSDRRIANGVIVTLALEHLEAELRRTSRQPGADGGAGHA